MKLAALFSGGKDSIFAIHQVQKEGHEVKCLLTVFPLSSDSMLLHHPNIHLTKLQANSMNIPQLHVESNSNDTKSELELIEKMLSQAKSDFAIDGLVHGGILSEFQRKNFEKLCSNQNLSLLSPIWKKDPLTYMKNLLDEQFHFIMISVSSAGLNDEWLGKEITNKDLEELQHLSQTHGFNLNFEGGEAETLVLDCPLFSHPLKIAKFTKIWDGYRGRFEIVEANLDYNA